MRILIAHNKYRQPGGEDVVAAAEAKLLEARGHDVRTLSVSNTDVVALKEAISVAWYAPYSAFGRNMVAAEIDAFKPDVVHVHNFFPILSPSIYDACLQAGVPAVQSLHNFRLMCPKATMFRQGGPCEICLSGSPYHSVLYGCYRDSRLQSVIPARMVAINRRRGTWSRTVPHFIALSRFAQGKFVEAGLPEDKIDIKPNFCDAQNTAVGEAQGLRQGALFVGRLSEEKGIAPLLEAWTGLSFSLRIAGDGPLVSTVARAANPNVDMLGTRTPAEISREMAGAAFLVLPSLWYEMFPMVLVEAFAAGLPAIVSRLGSLAEIVEDGVTGLHFEPNDAIDLASKVKWAFANPDEMGRMGDNARNVHRRKYTPEANYHQLMAIYDKARASF